MNTDHCTRTFVTARFVFVLVLGPLMSVFGEGLDFSLNVGSPKVPSPFSAADDIEALGGYARIPAASLGGSAASSDVNGLSYGQSEAADVATSPYYYKRLAYSVKHGATGNGGAPVTTEVNIDGAAGDTFALDFVGYGTKRYILRSPFTLVKAQVRNLTVQASSSDPEDDIDALALHRDRQFPVYVTFAPGGSYDPAAIYIINASNGPPQVFASASDLGLVAGDVIDGISVGTIPFGNPPPTALGPNVVIWLTLAFGSPSRGTADSIFQAWPSPGGVVLSAAQLNLAAGDEIDAIAVLDPGQVVILPNGIRSIVGSRLNDVGWDAISNLFAIATFHINAMGDQGADLIIQNKNQVVAKVPYDPIDMGIVSVQRAAISGSSVIAVGSANTPPNGWSVGDTQTDLNGSFMDLLKFGPSPNTNLLLLISSSLVSCNALELLGDPHLYFCAQIEGTSGGTVLFAGVNLNQGSSVKTEVCCFAPLTGETNISTPYGIRYQARNLSGTPIDLAQETGCDGAEFPGADPDHPIHCAAVALQFFTTGTLHSDEIISTGLGAHQQYSGVNNSSIIALSEFVGGTLTRTNVIPVTGSGFYPPYVDCIKFLSPDLVLVSVQTTGTINVLGQTFGTAGQTAQFLFMFDLSGRTPTVQSLFQTDPLPSGFQSEISSMAYNPLTDEVCITLNLYSYVSDTPFSVGFFNSVTHAGGTINYEGGLNGAFAFSFNRQTFQPGSVILNAFAGPWPDRMYRVVKFERCFPSGDGFEIFGESVVEGSKLFPGNVEIPVSTSDPVQLVFSTLVGSAATAPPYISISMTPDGHIKIEFFGTLQYSPSLENPDWNDVNGAISPYEVPMGQTGFWRARN